MSESELKPSVSQSEKVHRDYRYMIAVLGAATLLAAGLKFSTDFVDNTISKKPAPPSSGPISTNPVVRAWQAS